MPPAQPGDAARDDFRLSKEDRLRLPAALAEMFPSQESATDFLTREMRIPVGRIPLLRTNESLEDYWRRAPVLRTAARRADLNGSLLVFPPDMQGDS